MAAPALILAADFLLKQIGNVEALLIRKQAQAEKVLFVRLVIKLHKALDAAAAIMKILNRWWIEKAPGRGAGGADKVTELTGMPGDVERGFKGREAAARQRHTGIWRKLAPRTRGHSDDARQLVAILAGR